MYGSHSRGQRKPLVANSIEQLNGEVKLVVARALRVLSGEVREESKHCHQQSAPKKLKQPDRNIK